MATASRYRALRGGCRQAGRPDTTHSVADGGKNGRLEANLKAVGVSVMEINEPDHEQAAIVAKIKAEYDPMVAEAEYRELLAQHERGETLPLEQVLRELGIEIDD
jgi:hypothetical protein